MKISRKRQVALQRSGSMNIKSMELHKSLTSQSGLSRQVTVQTSDRKWQVLLYSKKCPQNPYWCSHKSVRKGKVSLCLQIIWPILTSQIYDISHGRQLFRFGWCLGKITKTLMIVLYLFSPSMGAPLVWSITCIWSTSGANIETCAPPRLRCTRQLQNTNTSANHPSAKHCPVGTGEV